VETRKLSTTDPGIDRMDYEIFGGVYTLIKKGPVILDLMKVSVNRLDSPIRSFPGSVVLRVSVNNQRPSHKSVHSPDPLY
jgi:hypothetical protein